MKNKWWSAELISSLHLILCIRNYMIRLQEIIHTEEIKCKLLCNLQFRKIMMFQLVLHVHHIMYIYYLLS